MKKPLLTTIFCTALTLTLACNAAPTLNIKISGVQRELLKNITSRLQLKKSRITTDSEKAIRAFYRQAPQEIKNTLKLYGYFNSQVSSFKPTHKKNRWYGTYNVNLGPPLKITSIDLKILGPGKTDKNITKTLNKFPLHKGDVFQTDDYNKSKQFLFDLADKYGYIKATLTNKEVLVNLQSNTADIILHLNTGQKYYFGNTIFNASFLNKSFLKKFLPYKPGSFYSNKAINKLQNSLSNSGFFQKVTVTPQTTKTQSQKVPIDITLTPRKSTQYDLGAGFSTDTGVRGMAGMHERYLTKNGHSFRGLLRGSQVQNNLELHYLIPGKRPATDTYDFNLSGETLYTDKGKSISQQLGFSYITALDRWQQTIGIKLLNEHFQLEDKPFNTSTLLLSSINWLYTKKDDLVRPNKGYSVNINAQGGIKSFSSPDNFLQFALDAKYMNTFFLRTQLILRGSLGFVAINDINELPLSLQFYTGGTQSLRGFKYDSIGPGCNMFSGSVELRQKIVGDWYFATFFDAGNASNDIFTKPKYSVGAGIVWRTIIGAFELTFAKAISEPGSPGKIQFTMGPEL